MALVHDGVNNYYLFRYNFWANDEGRSKLGTGDNSTGQILFSYDTPVILDSWKKCYKGIYMVNTFLANIEKVTMDATKKAQFIAEAKFIRAYQYFWLLQWYGGVPFVTKPLTIQEANTQTRGTRQEIVDFTLTELTASAVDLPASRAASEKEEFQKLRHLP